MNTLLAPSEARLHNLKPQKLRPTLVDVTRGARLLRIDESVFLDASIADDYAEVDRTLGHNAIGIVLRVLSQHLTGAPGGGGDETLTIALRRRGDGCEVELHLNLSRSRRAGQPCLILVRAGERQVD
jgi:hypothetical protein